ncbi:MAG: DUF4422 domain-containing protein [Lachnospiraceae bacterium]|nr:DUF4422 domain-containing protein [Lachnospiraceae bacterium]
MKTKIIIAMHKPYNVPTEEVYQPLHVGASGKETITGARRDDEGENISQKNPYYCELTGLYWAWKNLDADAIGLVHYRRYFVNENKETLSSKEVEKLMDGCDVAVPAKRRYYIESLYSHYAHTLDGEHLDKAREIISRQYPEYLHACDEVYKRTWGYMFNMCIMRREYLDGYCTWLFDILSQLEKEIGILDDAFSARLYGRVSEILFDVWLLYKQENDSAIRVTEVRTRHLEHVNWLKKGGAFLVAKFFGKKYKKSF